jgi:hypothetical protein
MIDEALKQHRRIGALDATLASHFRPKPLRRREVKQRRHRCELPFEKRVDHAGVEVDGGRVWCQHVCAWKTARPRHTEAIGPMAHALRQVEVGGKLTVEVGLFLQPKERHIDDTLQVSGLGAAITIVGLSEILATVVAGVVFERCPVVELCVLDLMIGATRAPQKAVGEAKRRSSVGSPMRPAPRQRCIDRQTDREQHQTDPEHNAKHAVRYRRTVLGGNWHPRIG